MRRFFLATGWVAAAALGVAGLVACRHAQATFAGGDSSAAAAPADSGSLVRLAADGAPVSGSGAAGGLTVRRGSLHPRLLLTGELKASHAVQLLTPATPSFEVQVTWLGEDGAPVVAGQPVVQFDNSNFAAQIEEKQSAVTSAEAELARLESDGRAQLADKGFAVDEKKRDLEKARIEAAVPPELLPAHDFQDRQLKLRAAQAEESKASEDLDTTHRATAADVAVQRVTLEKARRELAAAELGLRGLTLRAPRAGTLVIADHPYEGRKIQLGDKLYPGMAVASLPDLSSLEVEAALSDVDDGQVAPGMAANCFLDAFPETPHAGRVAEVAGVARESGRTALLRYMPVRVELAPWSAADVARLRPGMSVRVEIDTAPLADAVLVPREALEFAANPRGAARALLAGGGAAPVRLGAGDPVWCGALAGVAPGEALRRRGTPGVG
jgi:multidrug resistance efflux pump